MSFEEMLAVLERWKSSGQLFVSLAPPFWVRFEVDRPLLRDVLEQNGLTDQEFREMAERVGVILSNVLNRTEDSYVGEPEGNSDPEGSERREKEIQAVKSSSLYDTYIQNRYDLKKSSKAPSFNGVDWDLKVKRYDANLDDFHAFPYATLRLSYQRDFEDSAFAILGGRTFDSVQLNFSKDEVDHLIRVLFRVRERLEGLESEEE